MRRRLLSLLVLLALSAGACAKKSVMYAEADYDYAPAPPPPPPEPAPMDDAGYEMEEEALSRVPAGRSYQTAVATSAGVTSEGGSKGGRGASAGAPAPASPAPARTTTTGSTTSQAPPPAEKAPPAAEQQKPAKRMIHYTGYARLQATKTTELLEQVVTLIEGMGGHVEQLAGNRLTVRVPVERFDEAMKAVLGLGEVLDKAITAQDVTDAFTAVDLRLKTSKATRERLVALLAQARSESEKLALLAQIRRLSEEIDVMEGQLRTLASLASMSRITVDVVARPAFASQAPGQDPFGFSWIHRLSPFRRDVAAAAELSKMAVPTGFVALDEKKHFVAESADGASIWTSKLENDPAGDAAFWVRALRERLGPEFESAEVTTEGGYQLIRFVSESDPAWRYLVGVRVDGDDLYLVEVYYPSPAHEDRYKDAVLAAIKGGQS